MGRGVNEILINLIEARKNNDFNEFNKQFRGLNIEELTELHNFSTFLKKACELEMR